MRLYELSNDVRRRLDEIAAAGGEITPEQEAGLTAAFERVEDKVVSVALWHREQIAEMAGIDAEIARLSTLKATAERGADWTESYLLREMQKAGVEKVHTATVKVGVRNNSQARVVLAEGTDAGSLPARFRRELHETYADRKALLEAHAAGEILPAGVSVVRGVHLSIR